MLTHREQQAREKIVKNTEFSGSPHLGADLLFASQKEKCLTQDTALTGLLARARPQAAKWVSFFRKIGEPKKQHGTPRDMICHCITKVGRREHGKWVSIFNLGTQKTTRSPYTTTELPRKARANPGKTLEKGMKGMSKSYKSL